ncbi:hypothetical protein SAMN04487764_1490 [Gillisia sp. Hel1_33_143]|uniref:phage tail tape measure protein n=1 Tax=Gillisia sp. Hel1_33_143 TaxID=1336796 RepID=UPI00087B9DDA|nr:phage tail tape measure protein [Gillisia sp. Hel1_33_143]SDS11526.1 hypothetical protein SAMN04487764_1490 [Gillisia sp. Hel1_33_143]
MANNNALNLTIKVNGREVENTMKDLTREMYNLRREVNKNTEGTEEYIKANKDLAIIEAERKKQIAAQKAFREEIARSTDTIDEQASAMQEFGNNFADAFSAFRSGDVLAFKTAMAGVTAQIRTATIASLKFIATPIGLALVALAGIGIAAKEWFKYNEAALEANRITQQITQLSGEALDQARVRATALEKTFGTDFKESLTAASTLVEAFGISYEEAFDRIENGLIRGGKENTEFLDSIKEYPKLFAQAGFTVEDFQRIVNTGIDMKIYSDKLPDAIKEFSLSLMEETEASREALENAFGKEFTDKLFNGIQDGSITVKDALGLVAGEAENIGLNAQQAQLLTADLFKGAGEDAGGALLIFEAVNRSLIDQERALTPLEAELQRVADANNRLEEAQNDALKSDQYSAFVNDISVAWINFKAGFFEGMNSVLEGLSKVDTGFRKFIFQSVQATKEAFTGSDNFFAAWEKKGDEFDKKQAKREKAAAAQRDAEKTKVNAPEVSNSNNLKEQKEAAKLAESRAKEAIANEKKRLETIENLQKEYAKRKEDREADTDKKKIELERERELAKAAELEASKEVTDAINAEYDAKQQEKELENLKAFQERKQALIDELSIAQKETDEEKRLEAEEIRYQKDLEKFEEELKKIELTTDEKNQFKQLLEKNHQDKIYEIKEQGLSKQHDLEKKWAEASVQATKDLEMAKTNAAFAGVDVLKSVFQNKKGIYKALFLIEKGMAAAEVFTNTAKSLAAISANTAIANTAAVAAAPLTFGMPWVAINTATGLNQAAAVKINAAIQLGSIAGSAIAGFAKGGDTTLFGMGYKDETGHEVAGVVHVNEYVIPEVVRKDPEVPEIINYLEKKRKSKLGLYADGGDVGTDTLTLPSNSGSGSGGDGSRQIQLLESILEAVGITGDIYFGYEAEQKRKEAEKKLDAVIAKAKIKK